MENIGVSKFLELAPNSIIIDVRTPMEYEKGHIVGAVNMPLFSNEERASVGTLYKRKGREVAIERGLEYVGVKLAHFIREVRRITDGDTQKQIILYCWRGGMRSNSLGWLLSTAGYKVEVLRGGYKAYRRYFLSKLSVGYWQLLILGGPTGCGKSDILTALAEKGEQVIDLEAIARHRGSAFGSYGYSGGQPTSEQFGNNVFSQLATMNNTQYIWCEGESASIGKVFMPQELYSRIQHSKFIHFSLPTEIRLDHIMRDYGDCDPETLITSFNNISKRLGYDRAKEAISLIEQGEIRQAAAIALAYYDKGYGHSIDNRVGEVIASIEQPTDDAAANAAALIEIKNNL